MVAVLLIHIERKAVTNINPNSNLGGKEVGHNYEHDEGKTASVFVYTYKKYDCESDIYMKIYSR